MEEYQPQTREEMQDAIKDIFGPMFEAMLQGEMDSHLGYGNNERGEKNTSKRRNGYLCGEYKANEKFSGKGHAAHICKACSRLSAAE